MYFYKEHLQMRYKHFLLILVFLTYLGSADLSISSEIKMDGEIKNGYRVLKLTADEQIQNFRVYRGDYIKFELPDHFDDSEIVFPTLKERKKLIKNLRTSPYIKMKKIGDYPFEVEAIKGTITVIEYEQPSYKVLTAKEASDFIKAKNPLILDVRTPREYAAGHMENSILIPVQELQSRLNELDSHRNKSILIYCATGNRSTVASKILIDSGFKKILNLRRGIVDWYKQKFPVIR